MITSPTRLYYEAHITIEPVFDERLVRAQEIAKFHKFRVADLLMKKREQDTEERSAKDTFMTGHSQYYPHLLSSARACVEDLKSAGFRVWRVKIEDTLLDTRSGDSLELDKTPLITFLDKTDLMEAAAFASAQGFLSGTTNWATACVNYLENIPRHDPGRR